MADVSVFLAQPNLRAKMVGLRTLGALVRALRAPRPHPRNRAWGLAS